MTKMIKFYDTSSLLLKADNLFENNESFVISSVTLKELEDIKISSVKDIDIKIASRHLLQALDRHIGEYEVCAFKESMLNPIRAEDLSVSNDMKILATAIFYNNAFCDDQLMFITNDVNLKFLARLFFDDSNIDSVKTEEDDYKGYIIKQFNTDVKMEYFYSNYRLNKAIDDKLYINQYLLIKNPEGQIVDRLLWTGDDTKYRNVGFDTFDSRQFGRVRPIDVQQQLVADSLLHNKITMIKGKGGSGKSTLAMGYLFNQLEKNRINKIIIFCNTVAAKNAAKLGFLPGDRETKLLDSQIGNFLASKLGSKTEVERLIDNEQLLILPMSDIRGYDTTGMRAGIYITEAQNLDVSLMKLALQRIGEDSFCIIDGDEKTQVDDVSFAGINNGMRRVSKIFRGHDCYGEIELQEIHRSEIAAIAENL